MSDGNREQRARIINNALYESLRWRRLVDPTVVAAQLVAGSREETQEIADALREAIATREPQGELLLMYTRITPTEIADYLPKLLCAIEKALG